MVIPLIALAVSQVFLQWTLMSLPEALATLALVGFLEQTVLPISMVYNNLNYNININSMNKSLIYFFFLLVATLTLKCKYPSRGYFFSYKAMSQMDYFTTAFKNVNSKVESFNFSWQNSNVNYTLSNVKIAMRYNDHFQKQFYDSNNSKTIKMGNITLTGDLNYNVFSSSKTQKGSATFTGKVEQSQFIQYLSTQDGRAIWKSATAPIMHPLEQIAILKSTPVLTFDSKQQIQKYLNDNSTLKHIFQTFNILLRTETNNFTTYITEGSPVTYKYNNYTFNYDNSIVDIVSQTYLNETGFTIETPFQLLEMQNAYCPTDTMFFDDSLGGFQQVYRLQAIHNAFAQAMSQGLYDVTVDKKWEVNSFQFYMGDLSVSIPNQYPTDSAFTVQCKWRKNSTHYIAYFSHDTLMTEAYVDCGVILDGKPLMNMNLGINFFVKVIALGETLAFQVSNVLYSPEKFTPVDPNFVIKNMDLLKYQISSVLRSFIGKKVIGTDFKTLYRRFPAVYITEKGFLTIYDVSVA